MSRHKFIELIDDNYRFQLNQFDAHGFCAQEYFPEMIVEVMEANHDYCIAEDASALLAIGRKLGLALPLLEPKIAARLLTPESIGLKG